MRSPGRTAACALLVAGGFALASLERLVPNPLPMIRLGLGNMATLAAFALFGVRDGIWVTAGRVVLVAATWGGVVSPTAVLSVAGGAASLVAMVPLANAGGRFSLMGVSVAGAYAHILGQLAAVALLYAPWTALVGLLPILGGLSLLTGLFNGWVAGIIVGRLRGGMESRGSGRLLKNTEY